MIEDLMRPLLVGAYRKHMNREGDLVTASRTNVPGFSFRLRPAG